MICLSTLLSTHILGLTLTLGTHSGLNVSEVSQNPDAEQELLQTASRTNFIFGMTGSVHLWGPLSLQSELNYAVKGAKKSIDGWTRDDTLAYLEVPLFIKVTWAIENISLYALAGPKWGFLHYAFRDWSQPAGTPPAPRHVNTGGRDHLFARHVLGADVGVGATYRLWAHLSLVIEARAGTSLTNLQGHIVGIEHHTRVIDKQLLGGIQVDWETSP